VNNVDSTHVIIITGTPGVGKTTISNYFQKENAFVINLNSFIISNGLFFGYDYNRQSVIIDEKMLIKHLDSTLSTRTGLVFIEGHTAELVPKKYVSLVVVLRCNPGVLRERLQKRDYPQKKIEENIAAEIMDECLIAVRENFPNKPIIQFDTAVFTPAQISQEIISKIEE
jgi:adenylate kinase